MKAPTRSEELLGRTPEPLGSSAELAPNAVVGVGGDVDARRRYLQRYGLSSGEPRDEQETAGSFVQNAPGNEKGKALVDDKNSAVPMTGVPVQSAAAPQPVAPNDVSRTWSLSASLRGFYPDAIISNGVEQRAAGTDFAARAGSAAAGVSTQSLADTDQLRLPVLGDEPMLGKLFQRAEAAGKENKLAEASQAAQDAAGSGLPIAVDQLPRSKDLGVLPQSGSQTPSSNLSVYYGAPALQTTDASGLSTFSTFQKTDGKRPAEPAVKENIASVAKDQTLAVNADHGTVAGQSAQDYEAKKRELAELQRSRQMLDLRLAAEGTPETIPQNTPVAIIDRATPAEKPNVGFLGNLFGSSAGKFESSARVEIDRGLADNRNATNSFYDPYFVQTEFEVIQSDLILGRVVDKLKLQDVLASEKGEKGPMRTEDAIKALRQNLELKPKGSGVLEIRARDAQPEEAAKIANAVAEEYLNYRRAQHEDLAAASSEQLQERIQAREKQIAAVTKDLARLQAQTNTTPEPDASLPKPAATAPVPQPEIQTSENAYSTFSLNVSDVSFKLAAASLAKGVMPEPTSIRAEEFINAFDYRDPEPAPGVPLAFAWERAHYPFAHNRDLLRLSIRTASQGRQVGRLLNLVLLLDNSGSMERADRVRIIREALRVLAAQLKPQDTLSVVTFARTAQLWVDGVPGNQAGQVAEEVSGLTPQGGTNLEEAMNLAYQTALRHYRADGINRVVLLTDGAANLGDVSADSLKKKVEANRKKGIALDCFGIGWDGYNDDLLEVLTRNGDGRYGFINTPEEAAGGFAEQLAGALKVAASDVKVQVEFNPSRVTAYRQIGYAKHQLTAQQFRDNTVDAAELGAAESGNALYVIQVNPSGEGDLGTVRVRFKVPGSSEYREYA
ncbi:MAG: YfbK domain-containing protein, partial [Limisphaerales bacterium]